MNRLPLAGMIFLFIVVVTIVSSSHRGQKNVEQLTLLHIEPRHHTVIAPVHPELHSSELLPASYKKRLMPLSNSKVVLKATTGADEHAQLALTHAMDMDIRTTHHLLCVVPNPETRYRCLLLCKDSQMGRHLSDYVSSTPPSKLTVAVKNKLEDRLFRCAWAIAGGGDVRTDDARIRIIDAGKAGGAQICDVLVTWSSQNSAELAAANAQALIKCKGDNLEVLYMPYDPQDNPKSTAREMRWGPAIAHSMEPSVFLGDTPVDGPKTTNGARIIKVLSSPLLIVAKANDDSKMVQAVAAVLLDKNREDGAWVSYYEYIKHMKVHPLSNRLIKQMTDKRIAVLNESVYSIPRTQILEQFSDANANANDEPVVVIPMGNISATFTYALDHKQRVCTLRDNVITGVTLRRGDRLRLLRQDVTDQNGLYTVVGPKECHSPLLLTASTLASRQDIGDKAGWTFRLDSRDEANKDIIQTGDKVLWRMKSNQYEIAVATVSSTNPIEIRVTRDEIMRVSATSKLSAYMREWLHPLGRCMQSTERGDGQTTQQSETAETTETAETAETAVTQRSAARNPYWSPFTRKMCDDLGDAAVWDRPCEHDSDCPFYQVQASANGETLYRGGCLQSGYCEMPVGTANIGYTKVDKKGPGPMCKCPDGSDVRASQACCNPKGRQPRPQWVFELNK
jgi:hypothetical protein